jgi:hypothetical protein
MKKKLPASFDGLIANYYGNSGQIDTSNAVKVEELFGNYYGKSTVRKDIKLPHAVVLSLSYDDGETLTQLNHHHSEEYVVQHSMANEEFEEYVVERVPLSEQSSVGMSREVIPMEEVSAVQEYQVDVLQPLEEAIDPERRATRNPPPAEVVYSSTHLNKPPQQTFVSQSLPSHQETSPAEVTDDDFMADMQSILTGQKVFDPLSKKTIEKDKLGQPQSISSQESHHNPPIPETSNGQDIFDKIAQSMQYANAYDLGTVELENRFANFDKIHELEEKTATEKKLKNQQITVEQSSNPATVDSTDFIQDLDAIHQQRATIEPPSHRSTISHEAAHDDDYSRPFYDTGEHVLTGENLYKDRLTVGKAPGVYFSYGQIIAMADLYESVDQMMEAEVDELKQIKAKIEQSTTYYKTNKKSQDVSNEEWDKATGDRYLKLAEENYEHFSPNFLASEKATHGNNKLAWEQYHQRAIEAAQKIHLNQANSTPFLEWPLIINAFGDHFLTDAFAAGHTINKDAMIELFKNNFFNGRSLKPEGKSFFASVAKLAFRGEVKKKFSVLETYDPKFWWWHPNIDTENAFRTLLLEAATQQTDSVANLAVKALHDRLNHDGIEVFNDAGGGTWKLTGDGTLDAKNREIIEKAVQQSVDNVNDPSIYTNNLNFGVYFAKVWKYVPHLTASSQQQITQLMKEYTNPNSTLLQTAAAELIHLQVDSLIKKLIKEKKLKYA